jgi:hypothetical protein
MKFQTKKLYTRVNGQVVRIEPPKPDNHRPTHYGTAEPSVFDSSNVDDSVIKYLNETDLGDMYES